MQSDLLQSIDRYLDGEATDQEIADLERAMEADESLIDLVAARASLYTDLRHISTRRTAPVEDRPIATPTPGPSRPRAGVARINPGAWPIAALAAAIVLVGAVVAVYFIAWTGPETLEPGPVVATLVDTEGVRWGTEPLAIGDAVRTGSLELLAGRAEFRTLSGALVRIGAPAYLRVDGASRLTLISGRIDARVPSQAAGFTVATPGVGVVDLGTEFGVDVDATGVTRVYVYDGSVRLDFASADSRIVTAGGAWSITSSGTAEPINVATSDRAVFIEDRELAAERWRRFVDRLADDDALVAHYRFDRGLTGTTLSDSVSGDDRFAGLITGATIDDGRLPGKKSIRFTGDQQVQHAEVGNAEAWGDTFNGSFTTIVWFKVDGFEYPFHTLVMQKGRQWRLVRNGELAGLTLNTGWGDRAAKHSLIGQTAINDGRWHMAAISVKRLPSGKMTKRLYLDGELESESTTPAFPRSRGALWLGYNADSPGLPNTFNGWIDELIVFDRSLTADRIQEIYESGKPLE